MKKKKLLIYGAITLCISIILFSLFSSGFLFHDLDHDILKVAVSSMPETFDPITRLEFYTGLVNNQIYSCLFSQKDNTIHSILGKRWIDHSDSLMTIELLENMHFDNGDLITSKDVKASIERYTKHPKSVNNNILTVYSVEILDDYRLKIHYKAGTPAYRILFYMPIYSAKLLKSFDNDYIKKNPVSSGEYYLYSNSPTKIVLKQNAYRKNNKDSFNTIEIHLIPSRDKQVNSLMNNQVDLIINPPLIRLSSLEKTHDIIINQMPSTSTLYMMFDTVSDFTPDVSAKTNPFKNVLVRKAIWFALDMDTFIKDNLTDYAKKVAFPWPNHLTGYDSTLKPPEKNLNLAKNLLKKAGYPKGFSMKIYCIENKFNGDIELGDYVKSALKEINIDVDLRYLPSKEFYQKISDNRVSCFITGYSSSSKSIETALKSMFYNNKTAKGNMNRNYIFDPELNKIIEEIDLISDVDRYKVQSLYKAGQRIYDQAYVIPFYSPMDIYAYNSKVKWLNKSNEFSLGDFLKR